MTTEILIEKVSSSLSIAKRETKKGNFLVSIKINNWATFVLFAEKDGYVHSDKLYWGKIASDIIENSKKWNSDLVYLLSINKGKSGKKLNYRAKLEDLLFLTNLFESITMSPQYYNFRNLILNLLEKPAFNKKVA